MLNKKKKWFVVVLLSCLLKAFALGILHGAEDERFANGGERGSTEQRIFNQKGGAFFKAIKINSTFSALDNNNDVFNIEDNPVLIGWMGNSDLIIQTAKISPYSKEFEKFKNYTYVGHGYADQRGLGLKFLIVIGKSYKEFKLESEEIPIIQVINVNDKNYAIKIKYQIVTNKWNVVSRKNKTTDVVGKGYLIDIEYITPLGDKSLEDFLREEELRKLGDIKHQQDIIKKMLESAESELIDIEKADASYKYYQKVEQRMQEAYKAALKAINLIRIHVSSMENSQDKKKIIAECDLYKNKILLCISKVYQVKTEKEKFIIEELKKHEDFLKSMAEEVENALKFLEEGSMNNSQNFDELLEKWHFIRDARYELDNIFLIVKPKFEDISHSLKAKNAYEQIINYAIRIDEAHKKAIPLAHQTYRRKPYNHTGKSNEENKSSEEKVNEENTTNKHSQNKDKKNKESKKSKPHKKKSSKKSKKPKKSRAHKKKSGKKHSKSKKGKKSKKSKRSKAHKKNTSKKYSKSENTKNHKSIKKVRT